MKDYEFLPEAEEEMNEAALFYEDRSEGLGLDFLEEVEHTIASILGLPKSGPVISENIRRRILRGFPFGVLYAVRDDQIIIVAIAHLKRRPGYWKERL
ncbi:MAG: type II toxin-antitoxin system RelE/ParE family toxin [Chloroflexi bacterium]|nr:type II toxin-antitoxin system RelE/ParE family toxin [Chloroflexota bacterium]